MWWKKKGKEGKERVVAHLRSRLFPWNFIFDDVEKDSIEHFVPYAIQMCEAKGIEQGAVGHGDAKAVITREVKESVEDYLFDPGHKEMIRMHGKFATLYPFAFSQSLAHVILYRLDLKLEDIVDIKAICDLMGEDVREIRKRELFIRDVIARKGSKALRMFAKSILNKKVIAASGDYIGNVEDIIFTDETGEISELVVNYIRSGGAKKSRLAMNDMCLNMYSKNIVLKSFDYHKDR